MANVMMNKEAAKKEGLEMYRWYNDKLKEEGYDTFNDLNLPTSQSIRNIFEFECVSEDEIRRLLDGVNTSIKQRAIDEYQLHVLIFDPKENKVRYVDDIDMGDYRSSMNVDRAKVFARWWKMLTVAINTYLQCNIDLVTDEDFKIKEIFENLFSDESEN